MKGYYERTKEEKTRLTRGGALSYMAGFCRDRGAADLMGRFYRPRVGDHLRWPVLLAGAVPNREVADK